MAGLPTVVLASYRETGILRRLATTPVGPRPGARRPARGPDLVDRLVDRPSLVLLVAAGWRFDVALPRQPVGFVLALRARPPRRCSASGLLIAALVADRQGRQRRRHAAVLPADVLRRAVDARARSCPTLLRRIGDFTPLGAGRAGIAGRRRRAVAARSVTWPCSPPTPSSCRPGAARLFRWLSEVSVSDGERARPSALDRLAAATSRAAMQRAAVRPARLLGGRRVRRADQRGRATASATVVAGRGRRRLGAGMVPAAAPVVDRTRRCRCWSTSPG